MIQKSIPASVVMALLMAASVVTHADPVLYTPDRWHTRIYLTVSHMGLSNYGGRFIEHDIRFMFDEKKFENSSVFPYYSKGCKHEQKIIF